MKNTYDITGSKKETKDVLVVCLFFLLREEKFGNTETSKTLEQLRQTTIHIRHTYSVY